MPDPRKAVRPGEKLRLAAAQVNFLNKMMANPPAPPRELGSPPPALCQTIRFSVDQTQSAAFGTAGYFGPLGVNGQDAAASPTTPFDVETVNSFSNTEKTMLKTELHFTPTNPGQGSPFSRILICVNNVFVSSTEPRNYEGPLCAYSGLAWTRIRVFNNAHRFARAASSFPGQTQEDINKGTGCLDSAFFGPAAILGYLHEPYQDKRLRYGFTNTAAIEYPNYDIRWALVQL